MATIEATTSDVGADPACGTATKSDNWDRLADVWEQRTVAHVDRVDPYGIVGMDATTLDDDTSILDLGCGPGVTTVELARRAGPDARITGIDISARMIHHATHRRHEAIMNGDITPGNIELRVADVEHDDLGTGHDVAFSRFGVMFFDDTTAAFTNIASSLAPNAWFTIVTWAAGDHNPWLALPAQAAAPVFDTTVEPPADGAPGPFRLADVATATTAISDAGFDRLDVIDVTQPRHIRHGDERHWITLSLRTSGLADAYEAADTPTRDAAIDAVVAAMERYREPGPTGGWNLPAHARVYVSRRAA